MFVLPHAFAIRLKFSSWISLQLAQNMLKARAVKHYSMSWSSSTLETYSLVTEDRTMSLIYGWAWANAVLSKLYRSVLAVDQSGSFQTPQSCQFLNQSFLRTTPTLMTLGLDNDWNSAILVQAADTGFFREVNVNGVTLCDKVRSYEIHKTLNAVLLLRMESPAIRWFGHITRLSK